MSETGYTPKRVGIFGENLPHFMSDQACMTGAACFTSYDTRYLFIFMGRIVPAFRATMPAAVRSVGRPVFTKSVHTRRSRSCSAGHPCGAISGALVWAALACVAAAAADIDPVGVRAAPPIPTRTDGKVVYDSTGTVDDADALSKMMGMLGEVRVYAPRTLTLPRGTSLCPDGH